MILRCQQFRSDAGKRLFAGSVDRQHEYAVRVGERSAKLVEQVAGAAIAMRLEDNVNASMTAFARGGKCSANLGGVVAVVVDHGNAARLSANLKTPINAAKKLEMSGSYLVQTPISS